MHLPDTSVWVAYLRPGSNALTETLHGHVERGEVLICGPVLAELLAGARPDDRTTLGEVLGALPWADLDRRAWASVGELAAELRARGETLPLTDLEIAVAAHSANATLWTADRDFDRIAAVLPELNLRFASAGD